jgi:hypothetical protein
VSQGILYYLLSSYSLWFFVPLEAAFNFRCCTQSTKGHLEHPSTSKKKNQLEAEYPENQETLEEQEGFRVKDAIQGPLRNRYGMRQGKPERMELQFLLTRRSLVSFCARWGPSCTKGSG